MAFRLDREETFGAGISRILREELSGAMASLRQDSVDIHSARKSIKKLRAVMRLLAPRLGRFAKQENAALGEAGHLLSGPRDAEAVLEVLEVLAARQLSKTALRSLNTLRRRFVTGQVAVVEVAPVVKILQEVAARISEWPSIPGSFGALGDGLRSTYKQGRRALANVAETPTGETFHVLRKRVKDHWYQVRLLEGAWATVPREQDLRTLQDCLGHDHDLMLLESAAALTPTVRAVVAQARDEFRTQALAMAAALYAEKSGAHLERVHELWSAWREDRHIPRKGPASAAGRRRRQVA